MELCRYSMHTDHASINEFIWFGQKKGLLGSQNYIKIRENEPAHRFNMNVDLAGQLVMAEL